MIDLSIFGKILIAFGGFLILLGVIFVIGTRIFNLGKLPGDIFIQKGNFVFSFPIVTSIIISIIFTLILNLLLRR